MWALLVDDTVVETTDIDPRGRFHASMKWLECPAGAQPGDVMVEGNFTTPEPLGRAIAERAWRDGQLHASQWLTSRHREELDLGIQPSLTPTQYAELLDFRQALRVWPQAELFPELAKRPNAPHWISSLTP
ncbi:phage tail assembly chaperone [Pseudomonas sp. MWU13-3659]|uniref:phage tail assembly chaperone n=1 Tax=Pseudomonas sp. MWU13-3659 TaxID=2986964 RepID=UPI002074D44A|nr:phage tail assembly chaperone [Pseudomonas sp. MWU13-3659]